MYWFFAQHNRKGKFMALENKLGIHDPAELSRVEEKISKKRAVELFENSCLSHYEAGTFCMLSFQNGMLEEKKGFCAMASIQDIAKQDYILTPGRYVGIEEQKDDGEHFEDEEEKFTTMVTKTAKAGDVIMSVRAPVGDLNITPIDVCSGRGVCSLRMKNGNQEFLYYMLKYYMPQLINKESGTVLGSINRNDINGLEVDIPSDSRSQKK